MLAYNHMCVLYECAYVRAYVSACMRAFVCAVCALCMYACVCEQACVCVRASVSFKFLIHLSTARMHPPFTHASFTPSRLIFTSKFMHLGIHACPARTTPSWPKMCICRSNHGQLCVSTCVYVYQCVYSSPTCSHTSCVCAPRAYGHAYGGAFNPIGSNGPAHMYMCIRRVCACLSPCVRHYPAQVHAVLMRFARECIVCVPLHSSCPRQGRAVPIHKRMCTRA